MAKDVSNRSPLVSPYSSNSPIARQRKSLPTRTWSTAVSKPERNTMDVSDPRKDTAYRVSPDVRFYLDVADDQREGK